MRPGHREPGRHPRCFEDPPGRSITLQWADERGNVPGALTVRVLPMAWAELVLQYVRVLVWPMTTIVLVLLFRKQAGNLIDGISEFTGPANISVKRRISEVQDRAEEANADDAILDHAVEGPYGRPGRVTAAAHLEKYLELAEEDPEAAIAGAWREVRSRVRDVTKSVGTDRGLKPGTLTSVHVRTLVPLGLPETMVGVARELSHLRADVTKGRRIHTDTETALAYVMAAEELLSAVERVSANAAKESDAHNGS